MLLVPLLLVFWGVGGESGASADPPPSSARSVALPPRSSAGGSSATAAPPQAPADTGAHIAIAWEASPEAARTIAVSIQALTEAEKVTILAPKLPQPLPLEPADLVARLLWHGVNADIHEFDTQASDLGAAFLAHSAAVGADMLVKGAYSQSRLRQMVLGGRTRHILNHTTVPTLLAK